MNGNQLSSTSIPILYEDNHLLVVVKPPGVLSQADDSGDPDMLTLLKADLKERYQKPGNVYLGLVHRLDRPVGGVMLFAKTSKAASRMSEAVRSRSFGKKYAAVVSGKLPQPKDTLTHYLKKDVRTNMVEAHPVQVPDSKIAVLDYTAIASSSEHTLVSVQLHTGRSHQIRVQLATIGCPLVGDRKYGPSLSTKQPSDIALWSCSITVAHPTTKEPMEFCCPPPSQVMPWNNWTEDVLREAASNTSS